MMLLSLLVLAMGCAEVPEITPAIAVQLPYADFSYQPPEQVAGSVVGFQAVTAIMDRSYDEPIEFLWEFGDGQSTQGSSVNHIYSNAGEYTVQLKTVDLDGDSATATKTVIIKAKPAPPDPPSEKPEPPPPPPTYRTFGPGTKIVGVDIQSGTYRTRIADEFCSWKRLSGFGGTFDEIIDMDIVEGYSIVTILPTDAGFDSDGCSTWTTDLSSITTNPTSPFSEGVFFVGSDVAPGLWRSEGNCFWRRLSGFTGSFDEIIAIDDSEFVEISNTDKGFKSSCKLWKKVQ